MEKQNQNTAEVVGLSEEILARKKNDYFHIDPRTIVIEEGFNVRRPSNYGDIPALALNIVENGILEALEGYKRRGEEIFVMTEGHRRMKAVEYAIAAHARNEKGFEDLSKIALVPFMLTDATIKERLKRMGITGSMKVNLTDLEKADLYKRLIKIAKEEGKSVGEAVEEIRKDFGISQATVYNTLKLDDLDADIKTSIEAGVISANVVTSILREVKNKEEQRTMILNAITDAKEDAVKNGGKVKATAKNVKGLKSKSPLAKIREAVERLEKEGVNNVRSKMLADLLEMLENKKTTVKKIVDLCS